MAPSFRAKSRWEQKAVQYVLGRFLSRLFPGSNLHSPGLLPSLQQLEHGVPRISSQIESRYLASSSALDPFAEASALLAAESAQLLRMAVDRDESGNTAGKVAVLVAEPLRQLENWRTQVSETLVQLASCREVFGRLEACERSLQDLVTPLPHVLTMFRVESARLDGDAGEIFKGITGQIAGISVEVEQTFGEQFALIRSNSRSFDRSADRLRTQADLVQRESAEQKRQVEESLAALALQLEKNQQREVRLTRIGGAISQGTSEIIVALQAQDMVSQRLEHVRGGLASACELMTKPEGAAVRNGDPGNQEHAFFLLAVQRTQLDDIRGELEAAEGSLCAAVEKVTSQVKRAGSEDFLLNDFQEVAAAASESAQLSVRMLHKVRDLLRSVIATSREFQNALTPMSALAASFNGALESLAHRMRLISLNAQVQAVQIGNEAGLEVLAGHIAEFSTKTSDLAASISAQIDSLTSNLSRMTALFEGLNVRCEGALEKLQSDGDAQETSFREARERIAQALLSVGEALRSISGCTDLLTKQNEQRRGALDPLIDAITLLDSATAELRKSVRSFDPAVFALAGEDRYCMASERKAHQRTIERLSGQSLAHFVTGAGSFLPEPDANPHMDAQPGVELF